MIILGELGSKHILLEIMWALPKKSRKKNQGFGEIRSLFLGIKGAQTPLWEPQNYCHLCLFRINYSYSSGLKGFNYLYEIYFK